MIKINAAFINAHHFVRDVMTFLVGDFQRLFNTGIGKNLIGVDQGKALGGAAITARLLDIGTIAGSATRPGPA